MIIKIILFFIALILTFGFIEDNIEKIISHIKIDNDTFHFNVLKGDVKIFNWVLLIFVIFSWTVFYLVNQYNI